MSQERRVVVDTKRDRGMERIHGVIQNEMLTFQSRQDGEKQRLRPDVIRYYTNLRVMEDPPAYGYGTLDLVDGTNLVEHQLVTPIDVRTDVGLRLQRAAQEIKFLNFDESASRQGNASGLALQPQRETPASASRGGGRRSVATVKRSARRAKIDRSKRSAPKQRRAKRK